MTSDKSRFLLIDDDEDEFVNIRALLNEIKTIRYELDWRKSYEEGLSALQSQRYQACLLDYRLGARTGIDLLREAVQNRIDCPIIFLTGYGDHELDLAAMASGASDYLIKSQLTAPLLERSIRYAIKNHCDKKELRDREIQILQQDRMASLGLLSSSLAHEIGTPLGVIRGRAEIADSKAGTNEPLRQDLKIIISQIDRISKLVDALLHLARGKQNEIPVPTQILNVINDVVNLVQHELTRKNIELRIQVPPSLTAKAESGLLGQVFLNLMVNAVHAIEDSKKAGRENGHFIQIEAAETASRIEVSVQDSGCGIPEKNLNQIFKPFFTTKDIGHGTGLGLATSFNIVNSWGGSLAVKSPRGSGATFIVSLRKI